MHEQIMLTAADKLSPTWIKLKKHLEQQLEQYRQQNDADTSEIATARQRGRIQEVKRILALDVTPQVTDKILSGRGTNL